MNNKRKISLNWLQHQKMQRKICLEMEMDNIIHYSSAKTTIQPHSQSQSLIKQRPKNNRVQTHGAMLRSILKNQIWNPLIHLTYQSPKFMKYSKSTSKDYSKRSKNKTFLGLDGLVNEQSIEKVSYNLPKQKHLKSLTEIKQELMPFFEDVKIKHRIKQPDRRDNFTAIESKEAHQKLSILHKNVGAFKIHQIQWRKRPKPTFKTQKILQANIQ